MLVRAGEGDAPAKGNWYRFERGKRRGETYDLGLRVCESPLCWCTHLYLSCTPRESPAGGPLTELPVTLDVFEPKWLKHGSSNRASRSLGRDLARDFDAEDWTVLRRFFLDAKLRLIKEADLASFDDADFPHDEIENESLLIAYRQVVPFDEHLRVEVEGEFFLIDDLYCVKPRCPCRDVHLFFVPIPREAPAHRIPIKDISGETYFVLDLDKGRWELEEQGEATADSAAMMEAFFEQLRPRAMLKERRRVLRAMYRNYLRRIGRTPAPKVARAKVGRNDPCPCGSGKKHKKCCLRREHEQKTRDEQPIL